MKAAHRNSLVYTKLKINQANKKKQQSLSYHICNILNFNFILLKVWNNWDSVYCCLWKFEWMCRNINRTFSPPNLLSMFDNKEVFWIWSSSSTWPQIKDGRHLLVKLLLSLLYFVKEFWMMLKSYNFLLCSFWIKDNLADSVVLNNRELGYMI